MFLIDINTQTFQLAKSIANPALNSTMLVFAESFFVVVALLLIWFYIKKDKDGYALAIAFVAAYVIGDIIKLIVQEPRPCTAPSLSWINAPLCESGFSFPSSHATTLTGAILFLNKYRKLQVLYTIWLTLVLVGRVYLGQHYLTDVVAGVALSLIIFYIVHRYRDRIFFILNRYYLTVRHVIR